VPCCTPAGRTFDFFAHFTKPVAFYEVGNERRELLDRLRDDLEGSCLVIAYAGHSRKPNFIRQRQRELREEYGPYIPEGLSIVVGDAEDILGPEFHGVVIEPPEESAYKNFLSINPNGNPEEIAQACIDLLADIAVVDEDEVYI